jgi:gliding motility-associated-like protein
MIKIVQRFLLIVIVLIHFQNVKAQNYYLNNGFVNNGTVSTCSGFFYDSNISGNYAASEKYTITFCSGNVGKVIQMNFTELSIGVGDTLFIFDGNSSFCGVLDTITSSFQLNSQFAVTVSDTSNSGCLTFKFKSDATTQASGWKATIKCGYKCSQKIQGAISTFPARDANGYTNICLNPTGLVDFSILPQYPDNNLIYHQSNSTSTFHWYFGDGKDTSGINLLSVDHFYTNSGGYKAKVIVTDSNGCNNTYPIEVKIRTSILPIFKINAPNSLCFGDTVKLTPNLNSGSMNGGSVLTQQGLFLQLPVSSDSLFLPDGTGVTYTSNLFIDQFSPGQTLTNINLLKGIIIKMEHSYLGDIEIAVTAPNGAKVYLKSGYGSPDCYLGEPVDGDLVTQGTDNPLLNNIKGKGYDYRFNTNPTYGTMLQESANYTYSYTDNAGQNISGQNYLPAGTYASAQSLNALIGTTLNGNWKLEIKDWQAIDNGFLFDWKIEMDPSLYPNVESYTVPIVSQNWILPNPNIVAVNGTIAIVSSNIVGSTSYKYKVVDSFGCSMDTTININIISSPIKPNLGNDTAFCNGQTSLNLSVSNIDNTVQYLWNTGATGTPITVTTPNTYMVKATNSLGCSAKDTIVVNPPETISVQLGIDTFFCASNRNLLKPLTSPNVIRYLWNTTATTDTLRVTTAGNFYVSGFSAFGCSATDSISLTDNPINNYVFPNDTIICEKSSYLVNLNLPANSTVVWNDGNTNPIRFVNGINSYNIIANNIGCLKQGILKVDNKPLPVINLGVDDSICLIRTKFLSVKYPGATYLWNDNSTDSTFLVTKAGTFWAEATFNGCVFRDSIKIVYVNCACQTIVPNTFSPNGDGINDLFKPEMKCVPVNYHLSIFNRYGQQMFSTNNYLQSWDGKLNGNPLPVGTYYYIITYTNDGLKIPEQFSGSITILR